MENMKILCCPFCGAKPRVYTYGMAGYAVIECTNYDVNFHRVCIEGKDEEDVVRAWNRRVKNEKGGSD